MEQDLVNVKTQEWIYLEESKNPTKMGKTKALEFLGIMQKRIENLGINLDAYRRYAKAKNIKL